MKVLVMFEKYGLLFSYAMVALLIALVFIVWSVVIRAQGDAYALMLVCGGTYDSSQLHMRHFDDVDDAKRWADGELAGGWDIAYIYDSWSRDGSMRMLWVRSDGACYGDAFRDWTQPGP